MNVVRLPRAGAATAPRLPALPGGKAVAAWVGPRSEIASAARAPGEGWIAGDDLAPPGHGAGGLRMEAGPPLAAVDGRRAVTVAR